MWLVCQLLIHRYQVGEGDLDGQIKISICLFHIQYLHCLQAFHLIKQQLQ